jgi:hypothetical protein
MRRLQELRRSAPAKIKAPADGEGSGEERGASEEALILAGISPICQSSPAGSRENDVLHPCLLKFQSVYRRMCQRCSVGLRYPLA